MIPDIETGNNKESILVSIITPCFNSEKTIAQTIESVLGQSYTHFEYIIVDGGSKDRTINIISDYQSRSNGRLSYISEHDSGIYDAMNKGIKLAKGEIIGIVNSDDYYEPNSLQEVVNAYNPNEKYQVLYGAVRFVNELNEEQKILITHHRNMNNEMILHPASFVSRTIYSDFFLYDTQYKASADLDFFYKLYEDTRVFFKPIYKVLSNFRDGGISSTFISSDETNKIDMKYKRISRTKYWYVKGKLRIKHILKRI